jgi:phosphate transport system substrate-binding protein
LNDVAIYVTSKKTVGPSKATIQDSTYPLSRPLFVYVDSSKLVAGQIENEFMKYYLKNAYEFAGDIRMVPMKKAAYTTELKKVK